MKKAPSSTVSRTKIFVFGASLGIVVGMTLGFYCGFTVCNRCIELWRIERNFAKVRPGMKSGEAIKTIFDKVLIFPQQDLKNPAQEQWPIWGYDAKMMIQARKTGANPFTLIIDKKTDTVVKAGREYNTRFD